MLIHIPCFLWHVLSLSGVVYFIMIPYLTKLKCKKKKRVLKCYDVSLCPHPILSAHSF